MDKLEKSIRILKQGGIVIYPTDTAYAIGCRMDNEVAVRKLYTLRQRPQAQASPVIVDSINMAENYLLSPINDIVRHLMEKYWPGGLTIVCPCKTKLVPPLVRGGSASLGLRMPKSEVALQLVRQTGVPILAPSANFHGESTPYRLEDLDKELVKLADYVVMGICQIGTVSTVLDCTSVPYRIIRQGAVILDEEELGVRNQERDVRY
jgi:L-threonylcarbamoyladenylate synthase